MSEAAAQLAANTEPRPLIRLEDIKKVFYADEVETHALSGVHFDINEGDYVAIAGPSGCGKSTLLSILGLLDTPTEGRYTLSGEPVAQLDHAQRAHIRNRKIGFVFQQFNLLSRTSALENVELPMLYSGVASEKRRDLAQAALHLVGLAGREDHHPSQLSGGQQQRVAIARALVNQPSILLADEPTGNLDSRTGAEILDFMRLAVRELGQTIVMVTHDPVAASYADRVVFLADGRIVDELLDPTPESVLDRMKSFGR